MGWVGFGGCLSLLGLSPIISHCLSVYDGAALQCVDILLDDVNHWGYHELQPHQQDVITKSAAVVEKMKQRLSGKA